MANSNKPASKPARRPDSGGGSISTHGANGNGISKKGK